MVWKLITSIKERVYVRWYAGVSKKTTKLIEIAREKLEKKIVILSFSNKACQNLRKKKSPYGGLAEYIHTFDKDRKMISTALSRTADYENLYLDISAKIKKYFERGKRFTTTKYVENQFIDCEI